MSIRIKTVILVGVLFTCSLFAATVYADEPPSATSPPALTVVGKRITGDDKYFEISLEYNGKLQDSIGVGVTLRYDPNIIVPAASWSDGAEAADMKGHTDWANRLALPTLGLDEWMTHEALAYQTYATDGKPQDGYLCLYAEYPGDLPEATAAPSAAAETQPEHTHPVVVARFMYAGETDEQRAANKKKVEEEDNWPQPWNKSTTYNDKAILTVAPDEISYTDQTPVQCGFFISPTVAGSRSNNTDIKRFLYNFQSPLSVTAIGGDGTTTSRDDIVTRVREAAANAADTLIPQANRAAASDLEIITEEGKSAKQTGGLSLSDIYVIMFYDWDDTLLGSLTNGVGVDATASVNAYVKQNFIHPELRDNENYDSLKRVDNYRGEYPKDGPKASNPTEPGGEGSVEDGESYPLTNKLEYSFAGKKFYADEDGAAYPFAGGWTPVTPATMSDTWTALEGTENFKPVKEYKDEHETGGSDKVPYDDADKKIDLVSADFANITADDLDGGVFYVKAVYNPGAKLGKNKTTGTNVYYTVPQYIKYNCIGSITATTAGTGNYTMEFQYKRINQYGNGVKKAREPKIKMEFMQDGSTKNTTLPIDVVQHGDYIDVTLLAAASVKQIAYTLVETYGSDVASGATIGLKGATHGTFYNAKNKTVRSFTQLGSITRLIEGALANNEGDTKDWSGFNQNIFKNIGLSSSQSSFVDFNATTVKNQKPLLLQGITEAQTTGADLSAITVYQLQYMLLNDGKYVDAATAEAYCKDLSYYDKL